MFPWLAQPCSDRRAVAVFPPLPRGSLWACVPTSTHRALTTDQETAALGARGGTGKVCRLAAWGPAEGVEGAQGALALGGSRGVAFVMGTALLTWGGGSPGHCRRTARSLLTG